jgi:hypothetical protein
MLLIPAAALAAAAPAAAQAGAFGNRAPLAPAELETMRGGFTGPGGLQIAIAVQSETSLNGVAVLRTIFLAESGRGSLSVFGRAEGGDALTRLDIGNDGISVTTADGVVRVDRSAGSRIQLSGQDFDVRHLAGGPFGSIVANSGNDRSIDTNTVVDISIANATAFNLGSTLSRVDGIATDVSTRLAR